MSKYLGPVFTLLMMVVSITMSVFFATRDIPLATIAMVLLAMFCGYVVVARDWPTTWKPLLFKA